jgi:hypothetical protein
MPIFRAVFTVSGETGGTGRSCRTSNQIFYPLAHFSIGSGMVGFVSGLTGELHRYFLIVLLTAIGRGS